MKTKIVRSSTLTKKQQKEIFDMVAMKELSISNIKLGELTKKGVLYEIEGITCLVILEGELKPEKIFEESDEDMDDDGGSENDDTFGDIPDDDADDDDS